MKKLHLVCNAHIDPVWLWELKEGVAETLSTFRVAADFCEQYDGFVFNHNESMLYKWVEDYEPELFARIQKLVAQGKWHIMGGWYLQPDANMPCGESFVRQLLAGRNYFKDKFGVEPRTCINFDAFGHTRGLVEILAKSGHDSYLFCRPEPDMLDLPGDDFNWVGFSGSKIACHRAYNSYESHRGEADEKIMGWIEKNADVDVGLVLWGIGDHGGGPSRIDYEKIAKLNDRLSDYDIIHSTPENYFDALDKAKLPDYKGLLNPRYTGCYTTQARIKQLHRKLENELYMTEKMAAHAAMSGLMKYPAQKIATATEDLLMLEFHDILPGSAIEPVEQYSISLAGHGIKELDDVKTQAFLALCSGQKKAEDGTVPILVYNPHPFEVRQTVECEYQLPDQNKNRELFALPTVYKDGEKVPCQCEHEVSNFNVDWRKKSVFEAVLAPGQISRYDVKIKTVPAHDGAVDDYSGDDIVFEGEDLKAVISRKTGTLDSLVIGGKEYMKGRGFRPLAVKDDENSWAHKEREYRNVIGEFKPMSPQRGAQFSGIIDSSEPASVRVIETGEVRTIVEAVMEYAHSQLVIRYYLPRRGTEITIKVKVYWNEKMTMLKLSVPTVANGEFIGQTAYGSETLKANGEEMVSQKWNLLTDGKQAVSVINAGTYGSDCKDGELRITCLRSPGYSAGKSDFSVRKPYIMEQDRFSPFIDQGERDFEFRINASSAAERAKLVEREACAAAEQPMALSFFPTGLGKTVKPFALLSDDVITLAVFKHSEKGENYVIRLFNPTCEARSTELSIPSIDVCKAIELNGYEFKSYRFNPADKSMTEVNLMEEPLK